MVRVKRCRRLISLKRRYAIVRRPTVIATASRQSAKQQHANLWSNSTPNWIDQETIDFLPFVRHYCFPTVMLSLTTNQRTQRTSQSLLLLSSESLIEVLCEAEAAASLDDISVSIDPSMDVISPHFFGISFSVSFDISRCSLNVIYCDTL